MGSTLTVRPSFASGGVRGERSAPIYGRACVGMIVSGSDYAHAFLRFGRGGRASSDQNSCSPDSELYVGMFGSVRPYKNHQ
jgi:hypothetical protein